MGGYICLSNKQSRKCSLISCGCCQKQVCQEVHTDVSGSQITKYQVRNQRNMGILLYMMVVVLVVVTLIAHKVRGIIDF